MGKVRVVEGTIQEVGQASVRNGENYDLSFVKVDGERILNIGCDKLIRSFIKPGATLKLSIAKGLVAHEIAAVRLSDGEVLRASRIDLNASFFYMYLFFMILLTGVGYGIIFKIGWVAFLIWLFVGSVLLTRYVTNYRYKARRALD